MIEKKLLVVDDEESILNLYGAAFTKAGYSVRQAKSAKEALEILAGESIGVFFLDLNLPGMDGLELCRKIKEKYPMAILYAVTGYASLFELADCREAGFEDYFIKPVNLALLLKSAEDAFEKIARWKSR